MFSKVDAYAIASMYAASAVKGNYLPMVIVCGLLLLCYTYKEITNV